MPTYSYACKECAHAFDVHQDFSDAALTSCPECGGPLRKLFGRVGVVFKGSGFYRTDSRGGSVPAGGGAAASKPAAGEGQGAAAAPAKDSAPAAAGTAAPAPAPTAAASSD